MELLVAFSWLFCFLVGLWIGCGMNDFDLYYDRIYYNGYKAALRSMNEFAEHVASWVPDKFKDDEDQ